MEKVKDRTAPTGKYHLAVEGSVIGPNGESLDELNKMSLEAMARLKGQLSTPKAMAWMRVTKMIREAASDPEISINSDALEFLEMMATLSSYAWGHWGLSQVLQPLVDAVKSEHARTVASGKNKGPREWVRESWEARPDQEQRKAEFARQYAPLVKKRFDLIVTPETIARDWLPKTKKVAPA